MICTSVEGVSVSQQRFVVEHGAPGGVAGIPATQWQDSEWPFRPKPLQGYDRRYSTVAYARCSICGAEFAYKGRRPPVGIRIWGVVVLLLVVILFLLCYRFNLTAALILLLIAGALVLVILAAVSRPREPYFRQVNGPKRFKHRVRSLS